MTILNRIHNLFKADVHGILDRIEDPEMILKQALREMEEQIDWNQRELEKLSVEIERQKKAKAWQQNQLKQIQEKILTCLKSNEETLAKTLVKKKLEALNWIEELESRLEDLHQGRDQLFDLVKRQREELEETQQKAEICLGSTREELQANPGLSTRSKWSISEQDIEIALLKEKEQMEKVKS